MKATRGLGIFFMLLFVGSALLANTDFKFSWPSDATAATQALQVYTTPISLTWEQNFSSPLHEDTPPSPFTFYPNGTIRLANSQTTYLKFNVIPIPFQAPSSFMANSSYVVYSEKGPGPNCFLNWAFKQGSQANGQGNTAFVSMFGTAAQPCAVGATISIKLNAFGSQLQTFQSGGTIPESFRSSLRGDFAAD